MTDWTHPRIENPACCANDYADIAGEALAAFVRRRDFYPAQIRSRMITREDARIDLEAWRTIAKDWRWVAFGEGQPTSTETLATRIDALDRALDRWFLAVDQNHGAMTDVEATQGALISAMRWWAERERTSDPARPHVRRLADISHTLRAEAGHPTLGEQHRAKKPERKEAA